MNIPQYRFADKRALRRADLRPLAEDGPSSDLRLSYLPGLKAATPGADGPLLPTQIASTNAEQLRQGGAMAKSLVGGALGGEEGKPEIEAPEALAGAEAFAAAVAAKPSGNDPGGGAKDGRLSRDAPLPRWVPARMAFECQM